MSLANKHAVITGANQGLGERIARRFLKEGASVLICARDNHLLEKTRKSLECECRPGEKIVAIQADISRESDVKVLVKRSLDEFQQVEILVNCAGVAGPRGNADEIDWEEWKQAININLVGTACVCILFLSHMKKNKYGKIINISGGGATKPMPGLSAYAASKAGVVRFTETLAQEAKEFNIDANSIAPGLLATRLADHVLELGAEKLGQGYVTELNRLKKDGKASFDKAVELCVFLASQKSDGITGRLISAAWDPWRQLPYFSRQLAQSDIYTLRRIVPEDRGESWGEAEK